MIPDGSCGLDFVRYSDYAAAGQVFRLQLLCRFRRDKQVSSRKETILNLTLNHNLNLLWITIRSKIMIKKNS